MKPCIRCGKCCEEFPCPLAGGYGPDHIPCPVFYRVRGKAYCGLYEAAEGSTKKSLAYVLGINEGCTK